MASCPACKVVIDGRLLAGAAQGMLDSLVVSPEHWRDAPGAWQADVLSQVGSDMLTGLAYVRDFCGISAISLSAVAGYPSEIKSLRVALGTIRGCSEAICQYALANRSTVGSHALFGGVSQWLCDCCDRIDSAARQMAELVPY